MIRNNISGNVIVNCLWDNTNTINIRQTPAGTIISTVANNTIGTVLEGPVSAEISSMNAHVWYKVQFNFTTGWVAAEYLDNQNNTLVNFQLNLSNSLNLISFPILPIPSKFSDIFSALGSNFFPYVFTLDETGKLTPPLDAKITDAIPKQGYFIYVNNGTTVNIQGYSTNKTVILKKGINLVGISENIVPQFNSFVYPYAYYLKNNAIIDSLNIF